MGNTLLQQETGVLIVDRDQVYVPYKMYKLRAVIL